MATRARVLATYLLLQIPGWLLAGAVVAVLHRWDVLSVSAGVLVVLLWVVKDLLLFPVVRTAYEGDARQGADRLIGLAGVTTTRLAPDGYVRLRGELWRAELTDTSQRVEQGATVRVCASRGLTLFVAPAAIGDDGTPPRGIPRAVVPCSASRQRGRHV